MEKRIPSSNKFSELPVDFTKMVNEVLTSNLDTGLKAFDKANHLESRFFTTGKIYSDEIVVSVSLVSKDQLAATSVYASCDFDPKASSPTAEDLLGACVDSIGTILNELMSETKVDRLEALANPSLSALENVPFEWTAIKMGARKVYVRMDKTNPSIDQMAEDFLAKNDPGYHERLEEEQRETEKLFVTGKKAKSDAGSGTLH